MSNNKTSARLSVGLGIGTIIAVFVGDSLMNATTSTTAGQVGVVRNNGWFSGHGIKGTVKQGSGVTWAGLWTEVHKYPAQERFYTISANPTEGDKTGVDVSQDSSSDGVLMGVQGTFFFTLNPDPTTLKAFDDKFGTRTYRDADGKYRAAYDGDAGWSGYLDQVLRPVIDTALRQAIGNVPCAQLVSSCALVKNGADIVTSNSTTPGAAGTADLTAVQGAIDAALVDGMKNVLGGDYFTNIHFTLAKVSVPTSVQNAIDSAQAAYAAVSESQAKVLQAKADAQANETRQEGYNACPVCGQIDVLHALPGSVTVFAPGANTGLPLTNGSGPTTK